MESYQSEQLANVERQYAHARHEDSTQYNLRLTQLKLQLVQVRGELASCVALDGFVGATARTRQ